MKVAGKVLFLVLGSLLAALVHGLLLGADYWERQDEGSISFSQALLLEEVIWVDARGAEDFREGHWPDAVQLSEDNFQDGLFTLLERWAPGRPVVVYCDDGGCQSSQSIARRLREEAGLERVYWLEGGWQEMRERRPL